MGCCSSREKLEHDVAVGDRVRVRFLPSSPWRVGTVTSCVPLLVNPDGWSCGYEWRFVERLPEAEVMKLSSEQDRARTLVMEVLPCSPASRPPFLPDKGPEQLKIPPARWALTVKQFKDFTLWCVQMPQYEEVRRIRGHVTEYDVDRLFIKPLTKSVGCSIALLLNPSGLDAKIMISHAWGEDIMEALEAMMHACERYQLPEDTPVWWCPFSVYQAGAEDGAVGPTIPEQLAKEPFKCVIQSTYVRQFSDTFKVGMLVIHTSMEDVYRRLWCVHEIDEALLLEPPLEVRGVASDKWVREPAGGVLAAFKVDSRDAKCGFPADQKMLKQCIENHPGGFDRLDSTIRMFRLEMIRAYALKVPQVPQNTLQHVSPAQRVARVRDSLQDEWMIGKTTSLDPLRVQPDGWTFGYGWKCVELQDELPAAPISIDRSYRRNGVPGSQNLALCDSWPPFLSVAGAPQQMDVPKVKWSITVRQLSLFNQWLLQTPEYKSIKSQFGSVNMHDMDTIIMQPIACASPCSVSILFNKNMPLTTELYITHDWAEDIEEFEEALNLLCDRRQIPLDTPAFVCIYAIRQRSELVAKQMGIGEDLDQSLLAQALRSAVRSFGVAMVITTTSPHPWSRMWCVYEFARAICEKAKFDVAVSRAYAVDPPDGFAGFVDLHVESACTSNPEDRNYILKEIEKVGGFQVINQGLQLRLFEFLRSLATEIEKAAIL